MSTGNTVLAVLLVALLGAVALVTLRLAADPTEGPGRRRRRWWSW